MGTQSLVGFGDADAFYASAEAVRRPWMAGLPVGVLGNQGACVIARNYPMKTFGVKVGMPVWEAKVACPDGVYVKRDFRWYESISRRMLAEIGEASPRAEYYSIDEFFWEGIPVCGTYQQTAVAIRDRMKRNVGVPMTTAFARTHTLGKLPVTEIAGIGSRRAARLEHYGIKTCLDLAQASGRIIRHLLTVVGYDLWQELNGVPVQSIRPQRTPHKMISRCSVRGGSSSRRKVSHAFRVEPDRRRVTRLQKEMERWGSVPYVGSEELERCLTDRPSLLLTRRPTPFDPIVHFD